MERDPDYALDPEIADYREYLKAVMRRLDGGRAQWPDTAFALMSILEMELFLHKLVKERYWKGAKE